MTMSVALPPAAPVEAAKAGDTETVPLAAIRARIERACTESMALRHRIGTKGPLAALDVLVDQAIKAQHLSLAEFNAAQAERRVEDMKRGQAALQAELDALRAQLAAAKAEPEPEPEPAGEAAEASPAPVAPVEASEQADGSTEAPGETSAAPAIIQEAQQ